MEKRAASTVIITSTIGRKLPVKIAFWYENEKWNALKIGKGENKNPFFAVPSIPNPIISPKATRPHL
jgi:hypothetical protein